MAELKKLNFEEARAKAESALREHMGSFWPKSDLGILDEFYIRGKNFWIFFSNRSVVLPHEAWSQRQFSAYEIGDYGSASFLRDLRDFPNKLQEVLEGLPIAHEAYRVRKQKEFNDAELIRKTPTQKLVSE